MSSTESNIATKVKTMSISAVVTRANGKVEDLGLISYRSSNPFKQWVYEIGRFVGIWRR